MSRSVGAERPRPRSVIIRPRRDGSYLAALPERNLYVPLDSVSAVLLRLADGTHSMETLLRVGQSLLGEYGERARAAVRERLDHLARSGLLALADEALPTLADRPARLNRTYINLTNRCNLTCPYCYTSSSPQESIDDDLTLNDLDTLADRLARYDPRMLIILTGGEPLLRPDLSDIIRVFKRRQLRLEMFTNLLLLRDEVLDSLRLLDGISCTYHDILTRVTCREADFVVNLERLRSVRLSPTVQKTLTSGSIAESLAFMRRVLERGYPVIPNWFDPVGRGAKHPELELTPIEVQIALDGVQRLREEFGELVGVLFEFNYSGHNCAEACGAGTTTLMVTPNGDVYPCSNLLKQPFRMGSVRTDSLEQILESPVVEAIILPVSVIEECRSCEYRHTCYGGCRGNTFEATGRFDIADPKCHTYKLAIGMDLGLANAAEKAEDVRIDAAGS